MPRRRADYCLDIGTRQILADYRAWRIIERGGPSRARELRKFVAMIFMAEKILARVADTRRGGQSRLIGNHFACSSLCVERRKKPNGGKNGMVENSMPKLTKGVVENRMPKQKKKRNGGKQLAESEKGNCGKPHAETKKTEW